jgi:hypothetical protein
MSNWSEIKSQTGEIGDLIKMISLWILVDKSGQRIYYTGYSEESVKNYRDDNFFKDLEIVQLKGEIKNG